MSRRDDIALDKVADKIPKGGLAVSGNLTKDDNPVTQSEADFDLHGESPQPLNARPLGGSKGVQLKARNRDAGRHYVESRRQADDSSLRYEPERFIMAQPEKTAEPDVKESDSLSPEVDISSAPAYARANARPRKVAEPVEMNPGDNMRIREVEPMQTYSKDGQRESALRFEPPKKAPPLAHEKGSQAKRKNVAAGNDVKDSPADKRDETHAMLGGEPEIQQAIADTPGNYHHEKGSAIRHTRESLLTHRRKEKPDGDADSPKEVKGDAFGVSSASRYDEGGEADLSLDTVADDGILPLVPKGDKPGESLSPRPKSVYRWAKQDAQGEQQARSVKPNKQAEVKGDAFGATPAQRPDTTSATKADEKTHTEDFSSDEPLKHKERPKTGQEKKKPGKLQFSEADASPFGTNNRKLDKAEKQFERTSKKLDEARDKLPSKRRLRTRQVFNTETGKAKTTLAFENEPISQKEHLKGSIASRPIKAGANAVIVYAHGKVHQVERENAGVEAAHKGEMLVEGSLRKSYRHNKIEPYREVSRLEHDMAKKSANLTYQRAAADNAQANSNMVQRAVQKHKIKREYAKKAHEAQKAAKKAKKAAEKTAEGSKAIAGFVRRHPVAAVIVVVLLLLLMCILSMCSVGASLSTGGMTSIVTSTYLADDAEMYAAENAYAEMETELQYLLDNYQALHPGYDEYHFDLDAINHDPYVLISILSALHEGEWTLTDVQATLSLLFAQQYILTETVEVEVRYRTETRSGSWTDAEGISHSYTYTVEMPYDYYICTVELENFNLSHLPIYVMGEENLCRYAIYMATLGNRPDLFPVYAYPHASVIKMPTLYDIPPEYMEDEVFAAIITEATKYIGMPYVWGGYNPNTSFDCSGFVSWVINHSGWNVGRLGAQGLYNICTPVSSSSARPGDLIFFVGTYDTPGVSHVGIYVGDGMMLHCGDPIGYASIDTAYWQSHFYAFGQLP